MRRALELLRFSSLILFLASACGDSAGTGGGGGAGGAAGGTAVDLCGNGVIDPGEACEAEDLNGETCETRGYLGGDLACRSNDCTFLFSGCYNHFCGDDVIQETEDCDGTDFGGKDCEALGYAGGEITCATDCTFDTADCFMGVCGDGFKDPGEGCDDGNGQSNDGCSSMCVIECGDGTCGPSETPCNCAADCGDPLSCHPCECGVAVSDKGCSCSVGCVASGTCCSDYEDHCGSDILVTNTTDLFVFTDGTYNGMQSTMTCTTLPVTFVGKVFSIDSVDVAIDMNVLGELTFKLVAPDMTTITLMSLPGTLEAMDDGLGTGGDTSHLVSTAPISFQTGAPTNAENMGQTLDGTGTVCQDDGLCVYAPNSGAAAAGDFFTLQGKLSNGNWLFCVGDSEAGNFAVVRDVTLKMTGVP